MTAPAKDRRKRFLIIFTGLCGAFLGPMTSAMDLEPARMARSLPDGRVDSPDQRKPIYVVVVDAGSGGSRLHAFTFHRSPSTGDFQLVNGSVASTEPGLSAYANDPEKAAESLTGLMAKAKEIIPMSERAGSLFVLKATAGLRLLPKEQADRILEECEKLIRESGFSATEDSVSIMGDADEGIDGWLSLNFLTDRFASNATGSTFATLDLGGGSTEVTFATNDSGFSDLGNHIHPVSAFGRNMSVYTISYLGFGVIAAINEVLARDINEETLRRTSDDTIEIRSECVHPNISTEWNYGGKKYLVKGPLEPSYDTNRPVDRFVECEKIINAFVSKIEEKPAGLQDHEMYAMSGYFLAATEMGMIDPEKGGMVTVDAFEETAKTICAIANTKQPLVCLEMTYISVLLQKGFGLDPRVKLYIHKYIRGYELNWALGAAFKLLPTE